MSFYDAIRIGASGAAEDFTVDRSLRFNSSDSAYLERTPSSAGNRKTNTLSFWVKLGLSGISDSGTVASCNSSNSDTNNLSVVIRDTGIRIVGYYNNFRITNRILRDPFAWYHIVVAIDTTQASADDRIKLYINGVQETSFSTSGSVSQNDNLGFAQASTTRIGARSNDGVGSYFDGYLAEVNFIDGQALTPSSFAETNATTGQWNPIDTSGLTFGTTGFYLKFADNNLFTHFADTSSSARTVTRNGNVIHKSDQTKNGATSIYFDGSGDSLTVPDSSDFNVAGNDFTIEAYVRRTSQGNDEWFFVQSEGTTSNTSIGLHIGSSSSGYANKVSMRYTVGGSGNELTGTTALAANTWYHIAGVRDGNTLRIYVNGVQENSTSFSGTITDASTPVIMGAVNSAGSAGLTGYLDQIRWSNSCRYTGGTSFTPPTTQFTADSNTKLLVQSNVTGDLGSDSSGNSNNFTPNNFVVGDAVKDSPTNNFATFRLYGTPASSGASLAEGNLKFTTGSSGSARNLNRQGISTFLPTSGKWYAEVRVTGGSENNFVGVSAYQVGISPSSNNSRYAYYYGPSGEKYVNTNGSESNANHGAGFGNDDIVGIYIDMDAGTPTVYFSKNGQWADGSGNSDESTPTSGITLGDTFFTTDTGGHTGIGIIVSSSASTSNVNYQANFGQDSTFSGLTTAGGNTDANGIGDFKYTVPTGAKALCSANLPDPTIKLPNKHFDTLLYTGNGSGQTLSGLNFSPDWLWIKSRSSTEPHELNDQVRGTLKSLSSNLDAAENTASGRVEAFTSDGFTLGNSGNVNSNSETFVAWNWDAGETDGKTYTVTVVDDSGNKFRFDGFGTSAVTLDLAEGGTYIFNYPSGHPFRFSTTSDGTHGGGSEYTTGVTHNSSTQVTIVVAASAPTLYYYCSSHSGMGGQVNTNSTLGSSNFDGNLQSVTKVNATSGFSIVKWTSGANAYKTVGHGLGVKPQVVIIKRRDATGNWFVFYDVVDGTNDYLQLNSTTTALNAESYSIVPPTSTVFGTDGAFVGGNTNASMIAYVFSSVTGYSKIGSYKANGNSDGTFVFTGFRPALIIFKNSTSTEAWSMFDNKRDPFNPVEKFLRPSGSNADTSGSNDIDFLSNGFKARTSNNPNSSGATYIYLAFAEAPFRNARAR